MYMTTIVIILAKFFIGCTVLYHFYKLGYRDGLIDKHRRNDEK